MCVYGGQRTDLGVCHPQERYPSPSRQGLLLTWSSPTARLFGQHAPWILPSVPLCCDHRYLPPLWAFLYGLWELNSLPHV